MLSLRQDRCDTPIMTQPASSAHPLDEAAVGAALLRMGAIGSGESWRCRPLPGGVSSDIRLIELEGRRLCLKRALPRLRTAQLREAPVARNHYEFAWFREAGRICPDAVPPLIGEDDEAGLFVMAYLDPALYPVWKDQLHLGRADPETAAAVGARFARIHKEPISGDAARGGRARRAAAQARAPAQRCRPPISRGRRSRRRRCCALVTPTDRRP